MTRLFIDVILSKQQLKQLSDNIPVIIKLGELGRIHEELGIYLQIVAIKEGKS